MEGTTICDATDIYGDKYMFILRSASDNIYRARLCYDIKLSLQCYIALDIAILYQPINIIDYQRYPYQLEYRPSFYYHRWSKNECRYIAVNWENDIAI